MIFVAVPACVWIGVGMFVGRRRAQRAYQIAFAKYQSLPNAERDALLRSLAVFCGWTAAGLVGAILWVLLWAFLIIGHAAAEERAKSKKGSSLSFWLLVGGLLLVNEENLRSIEENADDFVIKLAFFMACVTLFVVVARTR